MRRRFCALVLVAVVHVSVAAQQTDPIVERFRQMDRDGDGKLSRTETTQFPALQRMLEGADKDGDGQISLNEARAHLVGRDRLQRPAAGTRKAPPMVRSLDIAYATGTGAEPKLTKLDVYAPVNVRGCPVMIYVHGGGWSRGDRGQVADMAGVLVWRGWVLISVNYRLAPAVLFDAQAQDVADAIAWVRKNADKHGGDSNRLYLMGHSAGAHLVALVATDDSYLKATGLGLDALKGVVPLDTEAYDIVALATRFRNRLPEPYASPFTQDASNWRRASPAHHVQKGKPIAPMAIAYSGGQRPNANPLRKEDAEAFAAVLKAAGVRVEVIGAPEKTHVQIATEFGAPGDKVAEAVFRFLGVSSPVVPSPAGPDDEPIGDSGSAYVDPEILHSDGTVVYLDSRLDAWVGTLDPITGGFRSGHGKDHRIAVGISRWSRYSNGPEWGLDAGGPSIFFVKDNARGVGQLWRAEPPWDKPRLTQLTQDADIHNWLCEPSVNDGQATTRVIVYRGGGPKGGNVCVWLDDGAPGKPHPFTERACLARFSVGTPFITWSPRLRAGDRSTTQVHLLDTETGKERVITADRGAKYDPWLWHAPEFGGETLLCVNLDAGALAIYRDTTRDGMTPWSRIAEIRLPADAPNRMLKSGEPVAGGRGAFGRSYFTAQGGDDKDPNTSIWLFGFAADGNHLVRRLDDGAATGAMARRLDPESYVGERELFVYYTLAGDGVSQMRRCRTGIGKDKP